MHQSFVTTAPAPSTPPTGHSGDNNFSSITVLLRGLAESHSPALYNIKFHGEGGGEVMCVISLARHLRGVIEKFVSFSETDKSTYFK